MTRQKSHGLPAVPVFGRVALHPVKESQWNVISEDFFFLSFETERIQFIGMFASHDISNQEKISSSKYKHSLMEPPTELQHSSPLELELLWRHLKTRLFSLKRCEILSY